MTRRLRSLATALALAAPIAVPALTGTQDSASGESEATAPDRIAQMDWLAGEWSGDMWGGRFHAYYTTPEGGRS